MNEQRSRQHAFGHKRAAFLASVRSNQQAALKWRAAGSSWAQWTLLSLFAVILCFNTFTSENQWNEWLYVCFGVATIFSALTGSFEKAFASMTHFECVIPIGCLAVWLYGAALGWINHNEPVNIIHNFAGMVCYGSVFLVKAVGVKKDQIVKLIFVSGSFNVICALIFGLLAMGSQEGTRVGESVLVQRTFYAQNFQTYCPVVSGCLAYFCVLAAQRKALWTHQASSFLERGIAAGIILSVSLYVIFSIIISRGSMLTVVILIGAIPILVRFGRRWHFVHIGRDVLGLTILVIAIILSWRTSYAEILLNAFSKEALGNMDRYEQAELLVKDFTVFGSGLGAPLHHSSYTRDVRGYGFEASYLNAVHKFGVFSMWLWISYLYTILKIGQLFLRGGNARYGAVAVGAMGYLIAALGNPVLLSPVSVLLHSLALILVSSNDGECFRRGVDSGLRNGKLRMSGSYAENTSIQSARPCTTGTPKVGPLRRAPQGGDGKDCVGSARAALLD